MYHEQLAWYLHQQGYKVSVILPTKAKRYLQALGLKSKNDKIDAIGLSRMGCEQCLSFWQPISENLYRLRSLTRLLESLNEQKSVFSNQLHAFSFSMYPVKQATQSLKQLLKEFDKQIEKLQKQIQQLLKEDQVLKEKCQKLTTIPGVGMLTFAVVAAQTNGFALFENQAQLVSYAGYDVVENQSGKHTGTTKISKKGSAHLRRAMHMPALSVIRHKQTAYSSLFERVYHKTAIKMKAYVAVQKKLLCLMYALWKKDTVYDPAYPATTSKEHKAPSGDKEPKPLFPVDSAGVLFDNQLELILQKEVASVTEATQDELQYDKSPEALFPVK